MASNRANRINPLVLNPVVQGGDLPTIEECANDQGTGMEQAIKLSANVQLKQPLSHKNYHNIEQQKAVKKVAELYKPKQLEH